MPAYGPLTLAKNQLSVPRTRICFNVARLAGLLPVSRVSRPAAWGGGLQG
jgi:hypothetical protein